jgi:hypothetical protein
MLRVKLGQLGMGKTEPTYKEVFESLGGRTAFVVTPCFEGGMPNKERMLLTPFLNTTRGIDWNYTLAQVKGKVVRVRIDDGLVPFLEHLKKLSDFILVIDDLQTVAEYPDVKVALKGLFSLARYRCDIYMTAHFYRASFGPMLTMWREGAQSLVIYGPPVSDDEADEIVTRYRGLDKKEFRQRLLSNPPYTPLTII